MHLSVPSDVDCDRGRSNLNFAIYGQRFTTITRSVFNPASTTLNIVRRRAPIGPLRVGTAERAGSTIAP
jgi:hypothetical protein